MALLDLLKDPNAYRPGGGSKELKYKNPPLLGSRVTFDVSDDKAEPTFVYGLNHSNPDSEDVFTRGGINTSFDRRRTDRDRISEFYKTPIGKQFLAKQVILQAKNPFPPQVYNLGLNTLEQVSVAGMSNVKRGGALSVGGIDVAEVFGAQVDYLSLNKFNIESENGGIRGGLIRTNNYKLGDPGKKDSVDSLDDLIEAVNPSKKALK